MPMCDWSSDVCSSDLTLQADSLPAEPSGKPKNTGVSSLSLLQRIFLTQESNQGLLLSLPAELPGKPNNPFCAQQREAQVSQGSVVSLLSPSHQFSVLPSLCPSELPLLFWGRSILCSATFSCLSSFRCNCSERVLLLEAFSFYHIIVGNSLM